MMMPMIVTTLMIANQNSNSPKSATEIRFTPYRRRRNTSAGIHCGMSHQ